MLSIRRLWCILRPARLPGKLGPLSPINQAFGLRRTSFWLLNDLLVSVVIFTTLESPGLVPQLQVVAVARLHLASIRTLHADQLEK